MEHLREYQDYVLAYRLRALIGGSLRPNTPVLSLFDYARKRLERQQLAKSLLGKPDYHQQLQAVEQLTSELNFGFWHNPSESVQVLRKVIENGGCKALESSRNFIQELLTPLEVDTLSFQQQELIATYYLGLFRASAAYLDADVFTRLRAELEPLRNSLPVFVATSVIAQH